MSFSCDTLPGSARGSSRAQLRCVFLLRGGAIAAGAQRRLPWPVSAWQHGSSCTLCCLVLIRLDLRQHPNMIMGMTQKRITLQQTTNIMNLRLRPVRSGQCTDMF